jgi:hypothetical protein
MKLTPALALTLCLSAGSAFADDADRAAAESLFDEGRQLMASGRYEPACAKLAASQRLDAALGTSLNLADCYDKLGRTASAWAEFRSAAATARKTGATERERVATERAAALEPRLSRLLVRVAQPGVQVWRNGVPIDAAVFGSAIPVDPGTQRITASATGKQPWAQSFEVAAEGTRLEVNVPDLAAAESDDGSLAAALDTETPGDTQRSWAWALGGVGLAGLATATVLGLQASSSWSSAEAGCSDGRYGCSDAALGDQSDAETQATLATLAVSLGGAALAVGAVLWVTAPDAPTPDAEVVLGPGQIRLRGRF